MQRRWQVAVSEREPCLLSEASQAYSLHGCQLVTGNVSTLYFSMYGGTPYAMCHVTAEDPNCRLKFSFGLGRGDARLSCVGGDLLVSGKRRRSVSPEIVQQSPKKQRSIPESVDSLIEDRHSKTGSKGAANMEDGKIPETDKLTSRNFTGVFQFMRGDEEHSIDVHLSGNRGTWTTLGETEKITFAQDGSAVLLKEVKGQTEFKGTEVRPGVFQGVVVQEGARGGRFRLEETKASSNEMERFAGVLQEHRSGLKYAVEKPGLGPPAKKGTLIKVRFEGRLANNSQQFDKGVLKFKVGKVKDEVIKGLDNGVLGMTTGEVRKLFVPSHLGYGSCGAPPDIPPNAELAYDIERLET